MTCAVPHCTDCRQPCEVVRVNYGPGHLDRYRAHLDEYGDGSACCEAEVYLSPIEEEELWKSNSSKTSPRIRAS
jgi:hypothetical protein